MRSPRPRPTNTPCTGRLEGPARPDAGAPVALCRERRLPGAAGGGAASGCLAVQAPVSDAGCPACASVSLRCGSCDTVFQSPGGPGLGPRVKTRTRTQTTATEGNLSKLDCGSLTPTLAVTVSIVPVLLGRAGCHPSESLSSRPARCMKRLYTECYSAFYCLAGTMSDTGECYPFRYSVNHFGTW